MHGGDIYRHKVNIDFSVNINPLGVPEGVLLSMQNALNNVECYPDISCFALREAIAKSCDVEAKKIICGNGASELLTAIVHALMPRKAILFAPSFYGYERALKAVECQALFWKLDEENEFCVGKCITEFEGFLESSKADVLFLCNPSNPVGNLIEKETVTRIVEAAEKSNTTVVLDECFMELCDSADEGSMLGELKQFDNLIIVRAFTKSFALPGVRIGYALSDNEGLIEKIQGHLPEWNVSVIAQNAGIACLLEEEYLCKSRRQIKIEREFLVAELEKYVSKIKIYPSKANFILFKCERKSLFEDLLEMGVLIRDCSNYRGLSKGFYRIAVKQHEENEKLIEAIRKLEWN